MAKLTSTEKDKLDFIESLDLMKYEVNHLARSKGWWDDRGNDGEKIALIHSELSEALEALREDAVSTKIPGFLGVEEELADAIIRIMDLAYERDWRIAEAILAKHEYNKQRPFKHGGKKF